MLAYMYSVSSWLCPLEGRGHVLHLSNEECTGVGQGAWGVGWGGGVGITQKLSEGIPL